MPSAWHDDNPYATPVADSTAEAPATESVTAPRSRRLVGFVLDSIGYVMVTVPAMVLVAPGDDPDSVLFWIVGPTVLLACIQAILVSISGQSIAKKLLGMRIVRMDGSAVDFYRGVLLRSWLFGLVSWIGQIGGTIALIDAASIVRGESRCLHDMLADTKVVMVN